MPSIPAPDLAGLQAALTGRFARSLLRFAYGELTLRITVDELLLVMRALRDEKEFAFTTLIDLCGIDYSAYGVGYGGLFTKDAVSRDSLDSDNAWSGNRFAVVYHLLSLRHNQRLRVRVFLADSELPTCPSVCDVWPVADWYEREVFDLFGIVFGDHPDLRRILTDYGFIGHPFRKDFPVYGKVEMRYDPVKGRVVYQPVTIKPREVVPRIRRNENFSNRTLGSDDG